MKSEELRNLHVLMRQEDIKRYKFRFRYADVEFEAIFFTDQVPFSLLFGAIGTGFSFELNVKIGYDINCSLSNDKYYQLRKVLGIPKGMNNPFKVSDFVNEFKSRIPNKVTNSGKVMPQDVIRYRSNVEEANKIYFMGWRDNSLINEKVSPENLEKTRLLIGEDIYEICKRKNLSSKWTDKKRLEKPITKI